MKLWKRWHFILSIVAYLEETVLPGKVKHEANFHIGSTTECLILLIYAQEWKEKGKCTKDS